MLAPLDLDPRLAFFFLGALIFGAAVPLAFGWARVFPEEPPPFGIAEDVRGRAIHKPPADELSGERRDPLAIVFLICLTVSYPCQIPAALRTIASRSIPPLLPQAA